MRSRLPIIALLASFVGASCEVYAVEVVVGWDTSTRWDSNITRTSQDEIDDFSIRTGPLMELRQRHGDVTGALRWSSLWEGFLDTREADNFEHFVALSGNWQINERNELRLSNDLARTDAISSQLLTEDGVVVSPGIGVDVGTQATLRNLANATFSHQLSPRLSLVGSVDNSIFEFENEDLSDAVSTRGSFQATRALSSRASIGVGAAFTRQDFDDTPFRSGSGSDVIEIFGAWTYQITPSLFVSMNLGPALNRPDALDSTRVVPQFPTIGSALIDATSCPEQVVAAGCQAAIQRDPISGAPRIAGIVDGQPVFFVANVQPGSIPLVEASFLTGAPESDDTITLLGALSLVKQWERSSARLSFRRRTSAASGAGASTDLTSLFASYTWRPERKWTLVGTVGWSLQASASDIPITQLTIEPATIFVDASGQIVDGPGSALFRADGAAAATGLREAGSTDSAFETTSYQIQFMASRKISRRLTARGRATFIRIETSGDLQSDRTTDTLRFEIGLRWTFDPMIL